MRTKDDYTFQLSIIDGHDYWKFAKKQPMNNESYRAILFFNNNEYYDEALKREMLTNLLTEIKSIALKLDRIYFERTLDQMMSEVPSSFASSYFYNTDTFVENLKRFEYESCIQTKILFVEVNL